MYSRRFTNFNDLTNTPGGYIINSELRIQNSELKGGCDDVRVL